QNNREPKSSEGNHGQPPRAKLNAKPFAKEAISCWSRGQTVSSGARAERARARAKDKVGCLNRQSNCLRKTHFCGRFHLRQNLFSAIEGADPYPGVAGKCRDGEQNWEFCCAT